jgi:hypothetical protein
MTHKFYELKGDIDELIAFRVKTGSCLEWIGNTNDPGKFPHNQFEQGEPQASGGMTVEKLKELGFVGIYKSIVEKQEAK